MEAEGKSFEDEPNLSVYIVTLGADAKRPAFKLLNELRKAGIRSDMDYMDRKMKAQMRSADRLSAQAVVVIGEDEVAEDVVMLRNMSDGTQEKVATGDLIEKIKGILKQ